RRRWAAGPSAAAPATAAGPSAAAPVTAPNPSVPAPVTAPNPSVPAPADRQRAVDPEDVAACPRALDQKAVEPWSGRFPAPPPIDPPWRPKPARDPAWRVWRWSV